MNAKGLVFGVILVVVALFATGCTQDIKNLQDSLNSVKGDITSIKGDITSIKGDITSIKGDITAAKTALTGMQAIPGDVTKAKTDIATLTATIKELQTKVDNLARVIVDEAQRLSNVNNALTAEIAKIKKQLAAPPAPAR